MWWVYRRESTRADEMTKEVLRVIPLFSELTVATKEIIEYAKALKIEQEIKERLQKDDR